MKLNNSIVTYLLHQGISVGTIYLVKDHLILNDIQFSTSKNTI